MKWNEYIKDKPKPYSKVLVRSRVESCSEFSYAVCWYIDGSFFLSSGECKDCKCREVSFSPAGGIDSGLVDVLQWIDLSDCIKAIGAFKNGDTLYDVYKKEPPESIRPL